MQVSYPRFRADRDVDRVEAKTDEATAYGPP